MPDAADRVHLLPKPHQHTPTVEGLVVKTRPRVGESPTQLRKSVRVACNHCRAKKIGCDATRPQCAQCSKRKLECWYVTENADETPTAAARRAHASIQKDYNDLSELVDRLRSASDSVCTEILKELRTDTSPMAILTNLRKQPPVGEQDPENGETHAVPSLPFMTGAIHALGPSSHYRASNTDAPDRDVPSSMPRPLPRDRTGALPRPSTNGDEVEPSSSSRAIYSDCHSGLVDEPNPFLAPQVPAEALESEIVHARPLIRTTDPHSVPAYCDERLHELRIDHWTSVPVSNEFAANAISFCIETDREILGMLDFNLFIHDLVYWGEISCSSLLVNSLLSWAVRAYIGLVPNMNSMSQAFSEEAQDLWRRHSSGDSLASVTALGLLGIKEDSEGHGLDGARWKNESAQMAGRLGFVNLFGEYSHLTNLSRCIS